MIGWVLACVGAAEIDVRLELDAPKAKGVSVASDILGWSNFSPARLEDGKWVYRTRVPSDARFEYQWIVDRAWQTDPNARRVSNGLGGWNSEWTGPDYRTAPPTRQPRNPLKRTVLKLKWPAVLYTPTTADGTVRLLVLADGKDYETRVQAQVRAQNLVESGKIGPVALLLLSPVDRTKDYLNGSEPYERFVVDEALPAARRIAQRPFKPEHVFVGGASLGGTISLRLLARHPDKIAGGMLSQSGAFWADNQSSKSPKTLARGAKLWLDWGTYEGSLTASNVSLARILKDLDWPMQTMTSNEAHNWTAWRNRFDAGLVYLFGRSDR